MKKMTREERTLPQRIENFIAKAKAKHGEGTYDYSMVRETYVNNRTKVEISCNLCGGKPFPIYPYAHTNSKNNSFASCQNCNVVDNKIKEKRWDPNRKERIEEFKSKMRQRHGENSQYSYPFLDEEYQNEKSRITVICHKCDSKPYTRVASSLKDLSRYSGCSTCNEETMREKIKVKNKERQLRNQKTKDIPRKHGHIYKIVNTHNGKIYIGYTTLSVQERLKAHFDETKAMMRGKKRKSSYLHNAMAFYGFETFKIEIIESFINVTPSQLAKLEVEYIKKYNPHYNVSPGGEICNSKNYSTS